MKPLILLVLIFMTESISAMDGANPVAAKANLDLATEVEKTAAEYRMENSELKKTQSELRMRIRELENTAGGYRMENSELKKTQADLRMRIRELENTEGGYRMEMKKPTSVNRVRQKDDQKTQTITKQSSPKCIGGDDQTTQLLGGVTSAFTQMLTATDDPGLKDGDTPLKIRLCKKLITGSPDKIMRQVFAKALGAMDLFGGVARCEMEGGVRVGTQCLHFSNSSMNWEDAGAACKKMNGGQGQLASITNHQTFFDHMVKTNENGDYFWVGGSKAPNEVNWTWQNGQTLAEDITVLPGGSDSNDKRCLTAWWDKTYLDSTCTIEDRYICDLNLCEDIDTTFNKCVIAEVPRIMMKIKNLMKNTSQGLRGPLWGALVWIFSFGFAKGPSRDLPLNPVCHQD